MQAVDVFQVQLIIIKNVSIYISKITYIANLHHVRIRMYIYNGLNNPHVNSN